MIKHMPNTIYMMLKKVCSLKMLLKLVVLWSTELLMADDSILIFVFMSKYLFYKFVLVLQHLLGLLALLTASSLHCFNLLFKISSNFFSGESLVTVSINLLKYIDRGRALLNADQLNIEQKNSITRNDVTSSLFSRTHALHSLLPSLDHLTYTNLELEGLSSVS